jgi:GTP cyclohydrolase I
MIDTKKVADGVFKMLQGLGVDPADHNFYDTPARVAKMYKEMFEPPELTVPVFEEHFTEMVVMKGIEVFTLCPHHLLPVSLDVSLAYRPNGKVIGASKLIRLVTDCNRHPLTQERLTDLIMQRIREVTGGDSKGEAVIIRGSHGCMKYRGVKSAAEMVTIKFDGEFSESAELRERFMQLVNHS